MLRISFSACCLGVSVLLLLAASSPAPKPIVRYGTYLGGRHKDFASGIAVDWAGNAYISGYTVSPDFPTTAGALRTKSAVNNNDWIGFAAKINPLGSRLLYSTLLGGSWRTFANAITVDSFGNAFIVGSTCSTDFPTTHDAFQRRAPGGGTGLDPCDAFVAKLDPSGARLSYATYLGGSGVDSASSIAVDQVGNAYVTGYTTSPDFPVTKDALQRRFGGDEDGFLVELDPSGRNLIYSTFLGGAGKDAVNAVALDRAGNVYLAGVTLSSDFPLATKLASRHSGNGDAFLVRIGPSADKPVFGTLLGGSMYDAATSLAVDENGQVWICGWTLSSDFPVTMDAFQKHLGGGRDAFLARIDTSKPKDWKRSLVYSSFLGGSGNDEANAVAVGRDGSVWVSGYTSSRNFPITRSAFHRLLQRNDDSFVARFSANSGRLEFASYLGGGRNAVAVRNDSARAIAVDPSGDAYITGSTTSPDLPVTEDAVQPRPAVNGDTDLFILRIHQPSPLAAANHGQIYSDRAPFSLDRLKR